MSRFGKTPMRRNLDIGLMLRSLAGEPPAADEIASVSERDTTVVPEAD